MSGTTVVTEPGSQSGPTSPGDPAPRRRLTRLRPYLPILVVALLASWLPSALSMYNTSLVTRFMIFGILALSLGLLWGVAGVVSFGHAVFFGIGAYAIAIVLSHTSGIGGTYLGLVAAVVVPSLLGLFLGLFLFYARVSGIYFGIVTLALSVVFETLAISQRSLTGGLDGLYGFATPTIGIPGVGSLEIWGTVPPFYAALVGLALSLIVVQWMLRSSFGSIMRGLRDDETRLEMLGYNTARLKTTVLVITCAMAGFAGALYTSVGFVSPSMLGVFVSTQVLVWVGVGGRETLWGPVIGALVVGYMESILSTRYEDVWPLLVGLFFVLVVLFWPGGIVGLKRPLERLVASARARRRQTAGGS